MRKREYGLLPERPTYNKMRRKTYKIQMQKVTYEKYLHKSKELIIEALVGN